MTCDVSSLRVYASRARALPVDPPGRDAEAAGSMPSDAAVNANSRMRGSG